MNDHKFEFGVKNFRKFTEIPSIELNGVNCLVGPNNAGKSSLTKALILFIENLKSMNGVAIGSCGLPFNFSDALCPLHINSFKRALCRNATEKSIVFTAKLFDYTLELTVSENDAEIHGHHEGIGQVDKVVIKNDYEDIEIIIYPETNRYEMNFGQTDKEGFNYQKERYAEYKSGLADKPDFTPGTTGIFECHLVYPRDTLIKYKNPLVKEIIALANIFSPVSATHSVIDNGDIVPKILGLISDNRDRLLNVAEELNTIISNLKIEYIPAHLARQNAVCRASDGNVFSSVVSNYMMSPADANTQEFVRTWMDKFGLGKSYYIISYPGEMYAVMISDVICPEKYVIERGERFELIESPDFRPLADEGMGSIQLMTLILQMANIIKRSQDPTYDLYYDEGLEEADSATVVVLEEPELNLHPKFQSVLAEFFHECAKYNVRFVIETHSEYLIRRAQVLVGDMECKSQEEVDKKNPFKVFYFPTNGVPFDMGMAPTGKFLRNFDEGFFDVAAKLNMEVIRRERKM